MTNLTHAGVRGMHWKQRKGVNLIPGERGASSMQPISKANQQNKDQSKQQNNNQANDGKVSPRFARNLIKAQKLFEKSKSKRLSQLKLTQVEKSAAIAVVDSVAGTTGGRSAPLSTPALVEREKN